MSVSVFSEFGPTSRNNDYAYIIMSDAVKADRLKYYNVPDYFRNRNNWERYAFICANYPWLAHGYDCYYFPKQNKQEEYFFYFNDNHPALLNKGFFKRLKDIYIAKTILVLRNPIKNKKYPFFRGRSLGELKDEFDLIVTDEKQDAELYNLYYMPDSFCNPFKRNYPRKYDLYFVGADKKRERILYDISEAALKKGLNVSINVTGTKRISKKINYIDYIDYTDIILGDLQSNCILEILQPGQKSYTLRWQEAVCLNKKILTNNKNIVNEKYYNPKYVKAFENISDIDWDFVNKKEDVNYNYQGDFSPIYFLDTVEEELRRISD